MFTYIIQCNTRVFHRQLPLFFFSSKKRQLRLSSTFSIQLPPPSSRHSTQSHLFFHQHCHRLSRDSLDSFAGAVSSPFLSPPPPPSFFPSLFVPVPLHLCLSAAFLAFLSFPPAAHHVLQYRRAASGVTPVIRDGPDEAFIILSKRVSLSDPTTHRYNTK